jgi:hypothetical protein
MAIDTAAVRFGPLGGRNLPNYAVWIRPMAGTIRNLTDR